MLTNINLLIKLQEIDKHIIAFELEKKSFPSLVNQIEDELQLAKKKLDDTKNVLVSKQLEKKTLELELAKAEENIKKHNIELNSIKSNDKYKTIVEIINNEKLTKSNLEDKILSDFDDIDLLAIEMSKNKDYVSLIEKNLELKKTYIIQKIKDIDVSINSLEIDRNVLLFEINNDELLKLYESIRLHQGGVAISLVDMDRSACSSCNMHLPFQKINDVLSSEEPVLCENCSKILYVIK